MTGQAKASHPQGGVAFPVDFGWRNLVVSTRLAGAAISALALAYWLELQQPQWAILTVYLLTQSSAGAAFAKGVFRFLGTLIAAACGVIIVKLFAQAPILLVGSGVLWMFVCYYGATRMRNFTAYGFMLAGYTGLLISFEGAADPGNVWEVAVNRASEISLGIACATLANALVLPTYAGEQLRALMAKSFSSLAHYAATALRPSTQPDAFIRLRADMLGQVVKFDALRSYTVFEAREMRADDGVLRENVRELLTVLAIARGLYFRLADFRREEDDAASARLAPVLEETITTLEALASTPHALADPERLNADLSTTRRRLAALSREIEAMAGQVPLHLLANAALITRRANKMVRSLSLVALTAQAAFDRKTDTTRKRRDTLQVSRREALLQGTRAALAVLVFCLFWYGTEWNQGIAGITGLALMSYQCVSTDDPGKLGWPYFRAVIAACFCAYAVMAFVYPWLEGFTMLAAFLLLVLVPLGLLIGTPRFAKTAGTFTIFFVAAAATGNLYDPDPLTFANFCLALVFGMFVCLMTARLIPVTSHASRRQAYERTVTRLLPDAATGARPARRIAREIIDLIAAVLPRLSLKQPADDAFLRGMLACSSSALELGRLRLAASDPRLPPEARAALDEGLKRFAILFAQLPEQADERKRALADGSTVVEGIWQVLERLDPPAGSPAAREILAAASSLRFLADRFTLDQSFLASPFPA